MYHVSCVDKRRHGGASAWYVMVVAGGQRTESHFVYVCNTRAEEGREVRPERLAGRNLFG